MATINDLLELVPLLKQLESENKPAQKKPGYSLIGEYVIVRCRDAGVWAGKLGSLDGREVILQNARRLWQWKAASGFTLNSVAIHGLNQKESKLSESVNMVYLLEACEVLPVESKAEKSILEAKAYEPA